MKHPLKNTIAASIGDVTSRLLGFIATAFLARTLGVSSFGFMSIGFSVLSYAILVASPGLHTFGTRAVAAKATSPQALLNQITSARLVLAAVSFVVALLAVAMITRDVESSLTIMLFVFSVFPMSMSIEWYFQGKEDITTVAIGKMFMYATYVVLVYLLVSFEHGLVWAAIAFFLANLVSSMWLIVSLRKQGGSIRLQGNWRSLKDLVAASAPSQLSTCLYCSWASWFP